VRTFINHLEEVMRHLCDSYGVAVERRLGFPGVWVRGRKIGAVGIAVQHRTSLHGFALNINVDLAPFSYIVPCGLPNAEVTSVAQEVRTSSIEMRDAVQFTCRAFHAVFAVPVKEGKS
jgi:lipoate-protein ligase B